MRNLFSFTNLRNLIFLLVVAGILILAISGYLTPIFNLSFSPLISAQSWLSQRYLAIRDFFTYPRDMATLRAQNLQLENEVSMLQSKIVELQESLSQAQILYALGIGILPTRPGFDTHSGVRVDVNDLGL